MRSLRQSAIPPSIFLAGILAAWLAVVAGLPALGQTAVYQVNCGGSAISPWSADQFFTNGFTGSTTNSIDTSSVTNPAPQGVYQTERYDYYGTGYTYTFPNLTPNGAYTLRFHLASIGVGDAGGSFSVNGTTIRSHYIIYNYTGTSYKALTIAYNTTADASGNITCQFVSLPVCGIEVLAGTLATVTSAPTGIKIVGSTTGEKVSWQALSGASSYNVLWSANSSGPFMRVNPNPITGTSYTVIPPSPCNNYYEVIAVNGLGEGPASAPVSTPPNFFDLSATPAPLSVTHGGSIVATVTASEACEPLPITLNVSAPAGITAWCFPNAVAIAYPITTPTLSMPLDYPNAMLNIVVGSNVAPGTYNVKVTGKSGTFSTSVTVPVTVN